MRSLNKLKAYFSDSRKIVICFFIAVLIFGIVFAADYGMSYDYASESRILFSNIKSIGETFMGEGSLDDAWLMKDIPPIENYKEKDHGKAMYYPFAVFRLLIKPSADTTYLVMKLYTFMINFVGLIFLYKTAVFLFRRRIYGLIASLLWLASPRVVADSFYNEKDMIFASLVIASIYFSLKIIEEPSCKTAIFLAITTAFATNARILGLFFPFLALIVYCVTRTKSKQWNKKMILIPILTISLAFIAMFIITPAMWAGIIDYFKYTIGFSANFLRWNGYVYYLGELYNNTTNPLPWHYLPVTFAMTTPVLIVVLIICGVVTAYKNKCCLMLLIFAVCPPLFAIIAESNIYNGWRHFFFIYAPLLLLATGALKFFIENKKTKNAAIFLMFIQLTASTAWIAVNHPHEYVYFNFLSKAHAESCDLDYWNISSSECLALCAEADGSEFTIAASDLHSENALTNAVMLLPEEYMDNVTIVENTNSADYIMVNPTYYHIAEETAENFVPIDFSQFKVFKQIKCDGITIMEIYKNENQR